MPLRPAFTLELIALRGRLGWFTEVLNYTVMISFGKSHPTTPFHFNLDPFPVSTSIGSYFNSNITRDEWIMTYSLFFNLNSDITPQNMGTQQM